MIACSRWHFLVEVGGEGGMPKAPRDKYSHGSIASFLFSTIAGLKT